MNRTKRNMLLSFVISTFFIFLSLLPVSNNEYVYVISKIGAAAGVINIVMMSAFLYFQSKKTRHLLN
ncbi:TPA: hypothetical protein ACR3Z0_004562 [Bacillus thuringiensis]|uniref:Uncharacterized protein n=1 Tax=Bacillus thuringiensis TaxID=1428 RepID=A0A9X6KN13_BACTU|nr:MULTISPECIES: hypothetical protein [Bacillus cereus group]AJA23465.1 hypothetical protein BT4G5_32190 [Bacillus thuringiensis serovar galleriae]ETE91525.1 hypothetical protein C621_0218290 [Bacillus thuringiensis serovar aizawai str. Leapi01]ETE99407.1 hypothetical protein C623_0204360 [Bacillus thuringiensis serovar aizawai str. Hu4-2]KAB1372189.1 hypothetical protein FPG93_30335 [Bacillus thuringiensis]KLA36183.1 hypothetical protein B4158_5828 [Bacillus cereus]